MCAFPVPVWVFPECSSFLAQYSCIYSHICSSVRSLTLLGLQCYWRMLGFPLSMGSLSLCKNSIQAVRQIQNRTRDSRALRCQCYLPQHHSNLREISFVKLQSSGYIVLIDITDRNLITQKELRIKNNLLGL